MTTARQGNSNTICLFDTYFYGSKAKFEYARYTSNLNGWQLSFRNESKGEKKFPYEESDMKEIPELQLHHQPKRSESKYNM